jgi:hypothetical protein
LLHFPQSWLELRASQEGKRRRLVGDQAPEHMLVPRRRSQDDHCSERVAGDVRRGKTELLDQRG